jgi:hypothetical protein
MSSNYAFEESGGAALRGRGSVVDIDAVASADHRADEAAQFVQAFAKVWAHPTMEGFARLLHPDVRLAAPMMKTTVGRDAGLEELGRLLWLRPDVRIEVNRWGARGDVVLIELTLMATVGGRLLRVPAVDRILLKDGLVLERVTYADPIPVLLTLLRHPRDFLRWVRSRWGVRRPPDRGPAPQLRE